MEIKNFNKTTLIKDRNCLSVNNLSSFYKKKKTLTLARDRVGQKPLYYSSSQKSVFFGRRNPSWINSYVTVERAFKKQITFFASTALSCRYPYLFPFSGKSRKFWKRLKHSSKIWEIPVNSKKMKILEHFGKFWNFWKFRNILENSG